ncbi:hypothetical protein AB2M62_03150 [Sphingomonas sp. MMS12-HWE2-04]|uniref:hypothetical protein n=1 Tax=Sphingomonas sp. MMS12-HWE2-04 TaxID=3234199 RepID=UPI0038500A34
MPRKLKVFRTAIGFHDAYVAAPSMKAAVEAWGSDVNLFARGAAEIVTDEKLGEEPLAHPGKVIKRLRGSEAEHFAALELAAAPGEGGKRATAARTVRKPRPPTRPKPKPDRQALDEAEEAFKTARSAAERISSDFRERERKLAREREDAERTAKANLQEARSQRDAEKVRYDRAMARWREA